jgi:hypothetical protein
MGGILLFILLLFGATQLFIWLGVYGRKYAWDKATPAIVHWIDRGMKRWFSRHKSFISAATINEKDVRLPEEKAIIDRPDAAIAIAEERQNMTTIKDLTKTIAFICGYMFVTNVLFHHNCAPELLIGSTSGFLFSWLYPNIYDKKFKLIFTPMAMVPSGVLFFTRYFYDTYRIGLWVFNMSFVVLYLSQWLGLYLLYLIHRTMAHHDNPRYVVILWAMIMFAVYFY